MSIYEQWIKYCPVVTVGCSVILGRNQEVAYSIETHSDNTNDKLDIV